MIDRPQVVRDEEARQPQLGLKPLEQIQNLSLNRNVERRDWLIGDDEFRLGCQRASDSDPLALATGKLMRVSSMKRGLSPTSVISLSTRGRTSPLPASPSTCMGSAMIEPTRIRGLRDA